MGRPAELADRSDPQQPVVARRQDLRVPGEGRGIAADIGDPPLTAEEQQTILAERARKIQEQPVLFYVVCFALAYIGAGSGLVNGLAWVFAAFWAMHKLPESSSNEYLRCAAGWAANITLCALAIYAGIRVTYDMLAT